MTDGSGTSLCDGDRPFADRCTHCCFAGSVVDPVPAVVLGRHTGLGLRPVATAALACLTMFLMLHWMPGIHLTFIYPSGLVVDWIYGGGVFVDGQWLFIMGHTEFILDESCSGAVFFAVVLASVGCQVWLRLRSMKSLGSSQFDVLNKVGKAIMQLMAIYPLVIVINGIRVWFSMVAHTGLLDAGFGVFHNEVHTLVGATVFLWGFFAVFLWMTKR